jgi:transposase
MAGHAEFVICEQSIERTFAWLHNYRRLRIRWERDPVVHMAFLTLACALICRRYLRGF